jgi:hypothetical protein
MNFFQNLVTELKGPLGQIGQQELTTVGTALSGVLPALLSNPVTAFTKAGLIAAGAPALIKIATAQPSLFLEALTDFNAALGQLQVQPGPAPVASVQPTSTAIPPKVG